MKKTAGMLRKRVVRSVFGLLAAGLLTVTAMPMQAAADEEEAQPKMITEAETGKVTFSTDYPGVTVKPGGTSTFTLYYKYRFGRSHCRTWRRRSSGRVGRKI